MIKDHFHNFTNCLGPSHVDRPLVVRYGTRSITQLLSPIHNEICSLIFSNIKALFLDLDLFFFIMKMRSGRAAVIGSSV